MNGCHRKGGEEQSRIGKGSVGSKEKALRGANRQIAEITEHAAEILFEILD